MTSERSLPDAAKKLVFYGGAGAGKSTLSKYMEEQYAVGIFPIAKALKDCAERIWGPDARTDRDKLQKLGMYVREIDEDAWINKMIEEVHHEGNSWYGVANDDMRFPNEYWRLKEDGFIMIRVLAKEATRVDRLLRIGKLQDHSQLQHASETAIIGLEATKAGIVADYTITNNAEPEAAYEQLNTILDDIEAQA